MKLVRVDIVLFCTDWT